MFLLLSFFFFFFNDTATPEIYPLSLHDALPISPRPGRGGDRHRRGADVTGRCLVPGRAQGPPAGARARRGGVDRKSTRLNSSHGYISYAVFCLKKKKKI